MAEKLYEKVDARLLKWPGDDRIISAEDILNKKEIFRGQAKKWKGFNEEDFSDFANKNRISPETNIAIARDGIDIFVVIEV